MTVINPNSVAGINSITVQSGNSLSVHKSNGELIRTITSNTGVSTFSSLSVGTATTDNSAAKSINIGLGASISQHTDNTLSLGTGGDEKARLDANGFLGIGTASVEAPLQVYNATNNTIARLDSGDATCRLQLVDSAGMGFVAASGDNLTFANTSSITERARIDSSGRVLINRTASRAIAGDNAKLQIENPSSGLLTLLRTSNDGDAAYLAIAKSRSASGTACQSGDEIGRITFVPHDGTDLNHHAAEIRGYVDTGIGSNDTPGYLTFHTNAGTTTTTERLRIDKDGRLIVGGGTHAGGSALVIKGGGVNTYSTMGMFGSASTPSDGDIFAQMRFGANGSNIGATINAKADADWGASNDYPSRLEFMTVPDASGTLTERFRIASNGDVKVISRGSSDSGAPFYVAVTGKSSIDYGGGSDDTACLRLKDVGSTNSYYHGIELRSKRDGDARIYAQDMGSDACDLVFATDNSGITEKLRITAAGRIGVNKSDPEAQIHVHKPNHYVLTNSGKAVHHIHTSGPNGNAGEYGGAISFAMGSTGAAAVAGLQGAADADNVGLAFITHNSGTGANDAVEMMRITSDGRIQANTQTTSDNEKYNFFFSGSADNQNCFTIRNDNSYDNVALIIKHGRGGLSGYSGKAVSFRGNDFTEEGSIVIGTSSVAYNTSSDYRLKENAVTISDGITRLKTLKPYRFNFKKDTGTTVDGFFAHEVTAVPEAISGEKDAMKKIYYEEGDTLPSGKNVGDFKEFSSTEISAQSIDHSKLVPLLTAALQEAVTKIETLETKVAALEGG